MGKGSEEKQSRRSPSAWKGVEFQIENLIPGTIIVAESIFLYSPVKCKCFTIPPEYPDAVIVVVFTAVCYATGLISAYLSRALLDWISERGPRAIVFYWFAHHDVGPLVEKAQKQKNDKFDTDYTREISKRWLPVIGKWNAVYRWALRQNEKEEVGRRRSQGRVVRNLFFPLVLLGVIIANSIDANVLLLSVILIGMVILSLLLYAYAEYVNFAEAYDILDALSENDNAKSKE